MQQVIVCKVYYLLLASEEYPLQCACLVWVVSITSLLLFVVNQVEYVEYVCTCSQLVFLIISFSSSSWPVLYMLSFYAISHQEMNILTFDFSPSFQQHSLFFVIFFSPLPPSVVSFSSSLFSLFLSFFSPLPLPLPLPLLFPPLLPQVINSNVPYGDTFYVSCTFCMTCVAHNRTRLRVTSNICFKKNCWGVVKSKRGREEGVSEKEIGKGQGGRETEGGEVRS